MTIGGIIWLAVSVFAFALGALAPVWIELGNLPEESENEND